MHRCLPLLCWLFASSAALAAEPPGYYAPAAGLTGTPLRNALHGIIDDHDGISYAATVNALEELDEDPANSARLILLYERTSWLKSRFVSDYPGGWNREHCWPNALGIDDTLPMYADLYNLRACGEPSNNDRGNLYYDESLASEGSYEHPAGPTTLLCSQDDNSWELPLEVKGDLARAMFYMDARYEGGSGEPNLRLTDNTSLISTNSNYMGRLSTLLIWHFLDPVSAAERTRIEGVYGHQGNRNPFVDRPEWVEAVYGEVFKLRCSIEGQWLVLAWPAILPGDLGVIETSTNLTTWTTAQLSVVDVNGKHTAKVPLNTKRYYRLRLRERAG